MIAKLADDVMQLLFKSIYNIFDNCLTVNVRQNATEYV